MEEKKWDRHLMNFGILEAGVMKEFEFEYYGDGEIVMDGKQQRVKSSCHCISLGYFPQGRKLMGQLVAKAWSANSLAASHSSAFTVGCTMLEDGKEVAYTFTIQYTMMNPVQVSPERKAVHQAMMILRSYVISEPRIAKIYNQLTDLNNKLVAKEKKDGPTTSVS